MPGLPGPRAAAESADSDNEVTVGNPCLSGGALDIFLEVMRPPDASAVVIASQGGDEHRVIGAALGARVPYVGLLASRRRGAAVLEALGLDAEQRARVHTPAGLDIGAQSPGEVALSIMAEIIAETRSTGPFPMTGLKTGLRSQAIDPVCGMSVAVTESAIGVEAQDGRVYFCCPGCRDAFLADPGRYTHTL